MKMKEETIDHLIILLALLAPMLLVALSKWQDSLNTWYIPLSQNPNTYFSDNLERNILKVAPTEKSVNLYFIADMNCACTQATLNILKAAMQNSTKSKIQLNVLDIHSPKAKQIGWQNIINEIPATPTLLVTDHERLVYAGPVTAGDMCTTNVQKILGLSILEAEPQKPILNWLEKGCYCPIKPNLA